jgi:hypothetical protein
MSDRVRQVHGEIVIRPVARRNPANAVEPGSAGKAQRAVDQAGRLPPSQPRRFIDHRPRSHQARAAILHLAPAAGTLELLGDRLERLEAESAPQRFEREDLARRDVPEVDALAEPGDELGLLMLLRRLPDETPDLVAHAGREPLERVLQQIPGVVVDPDARPALAALDDDPVRTPFEVLERLLCQRSGDGCCLGLPPTSVIRMGQRRGCDDGAVIARAGADRAPLTERTEAEPRARSPCSRQCPGPPQPRGRPAEGVRSVARQHSSLRRSTSGPNTDVRTTA